MSSSTLTIRIDDDLKRGASEVADYYGLDLSSVTRAFYKQMVNTRRIPLTFAPDEPEEGEYRIVRSKTFPIKPMTRDEAILQMNLLGHCFFAFREEDANGAFALVFR